MSQPSRSESRRDNTSSILDELRSTTRARHEHLETLVPIESALRSTTRYLKLLELFYGIYLPLEERVAAVPELRLFLTDYDQRRKTPWLHADLEHLGSDAARLPLCDRLPTVVSLAGAFGGLYVMEGATLGGQILSRSAKQQLGLDAATGCRFFSSYGDEVGRMWKGFRESITRFCLERPGERQTILDTAASTFDCFGEWLSQAAG